MPVNNEYQRFRNEDLVLKVSTNVNRIIWDESKYDAFLDELCSDREYQKEAIRTILRYWLGGNYSNLRDLAKSNFNNPFLQARYGSWASMERHLELPDQLSASIDLATGTGKSFVLYGLAAIMMAEGAVDQVLVLCPSRTIEIGLTEKFRELASNNELQVSLPSGSIISIPHIINADKSITVGCICIENDDAVLEHVNSSIRDSLTGKGARTLVLNDEFHHVTSKSGAKIKRWKEFLTDARYGFNYIIGVSGTCYIGDDYFSDVIYRYSLRQAMEDFYVKRVEYVAEMPRLADPDEKWQIIYNRHEETKKKLRNRNILPLTIIVTSTIALCKDLAEYIKSFLIEAEKCTIESVNERVLVVYNNAPDVSRLSYVDNSSSKVEWIVSVSMLNEGWDVKRVFQIVPHEERAFNSKLLIAQVLGRGLRIPRGWEGHPPFVTVFNHDAWSTRIRHLVNEILEIEKRLSSFVINESIHHFDLDQIDYTIQPTSIIKTPMSSGYRLLEKGYVDLPADASEQSMDVEFERAGTDQRYNWQTKVIRKTYTSREIAIHMYQRLEAEQDPEDPDPQMRTFYTDQFPIERLEKIVEDSLARRGMTVATDNIRQKFLQALGTLRRKSSEYVRYTSIPNRFHQISTHQRHSDSVSASDLLRDKAFFFTNQTRSTLDDEQIEFFDEATDPGNDYRHILVSNLHDFKTPLNAVIADSNPERKFILQLINQSNISHYDGWIKSTSIRFYEIDYMWRRSKVGEHTKKGKFSPDFFIKSGNLILVVEIKGDEEINEPSDENRKKNEFAIAHFERINQYLQDKGSHIRYKFNFLTPKDFGTYFQYLRNGNITNYSSDLDVKLTEDI